MNALMKPMMGGSLDQQIDRMLDELLSTFGTQGEMQPACNIWEDDKAFSISVAVPGWHANYITVSVEDRLLTIKGERTESEAPREYHLRQFAGSRFVRQFTLPSSVRTDNASASQKDGVLTVSFAKREEAQPRQITIQEA